MKQLKFNFGRNYKKQFGGELLVGKRKTQRPLVVKKPIHLVLRSSLPKVFVPWNRSLEKLIYKVAAQFHITIYDLALNWNHIHFLILIKDRQDYVKFIRALTSILSQKIKLKLGKGTEVFGLRPFTRILEWGRDFKNTLNYLLSNQLESVGLIKRLEKQKKLKGKPAGVETKNVPLNNRKGPCSESINVNDPQISEWGLFIEFFSLQCLKVLHLNSNNTYVQKQNLDLSSTKVFLRPNKSCSYTSVFELNLGIFFANEKTPMQT